MVASADSPAEQAAGILAVALVASVVVGGAFFARRNLRMGRGDRRGATRLASFVFAVMLVAWVFGESHVPAQGEVGLLVMRASFALLNSGLLWLLYISLEPFVRRRWPGSLISWNRLLSGGFRDPLVGRNLLVGCVLGASAVLLWYSTYPVASWLGVAQEQPFVGPLRMFLGARSVLAASFWALASPVFLAHVMLFVFFLLRVLVRSEWAAAVLTVAVFVGVEALGSDTLLLHALADALAYGATIFVLVRFGLLAVVTGFAFGTILQWFPITTDLSAWYAGMGVTGVLVLLALTTYAFYTSIGRQPLFGRLSLED